MASRDEERENEKGFRIVDRRRFTAEGETRADAPDAPRVSPPAEPRVGAPPKPPQGQRQPAAAQSGIDFITFAASLATNALAALGALPEEQARGLPKSPELAREYIEILGMLQEKTRGNLTREEEQALQQLLTELRLQFVEATQRR